MRWLTMLGWLGLLGPAGAVNLLGNPGFEALDAAGSLVGWHWEAGAAKGTLAVVDDARSGARAVRISNPSPRTPHVFCTLRQEVRVEPGVTYTLSAYVKGPAGGAWIGGGPGWTVRQPLGQGDAWRRVTVTFTVDAKTLTWPLLILSEEATPGFVIDDVQLERGPAASDWRDTGTVTPNQLSLSLEPVELGANLLPNPSFEEVADGLPVGWTWDARNTTATCRLVETGNFGQRAVEIANQTPFGAHVYGHLLVDGGVPVKPNTLYTLSFYCRSGDGLGLAWVGGPNDWRVRLRIPRTEGHWRRVAGGFRTGPEETRVAIMVLTENPTTPFWVDDLQLEEGTRLTPFDSPSVALPDTIQLGPEPLRTSDGVALLAGWWKPDVYPPDEWHFLRRELTLQGSVRLAEPLPGGRLSVSVSDGATALARTELAPAEGLGPRSALLLRYTPPAEPTPHLTITASVRDGAGAERLTETRTWRVVAEPEVRSHLAAVAARLPAVVARAAHDDYQRATAALIRFFSQAAEQDLAMGEVGRAYDAAVQMLAMADRADAAPPAPPVPRYVTSPLTVAGPAMIGQARWPDGRTEQRPIPFTGYGHFGLVRRMAAEFKEFGHNLIQIEFGPRSVLVDEETVNQQPIDDFLAVCDAAAAAGVQVNLLLSPHYFPAWALERWPHLRAETGGFFRFAIHEPEAQAVIERFLRVVIPRVAGHPALHSLCLSNEPVSVDLSGSPAATAAWRAWLAERHGTVAAVNQRWGTDHASFAAVPVPAPRYEASAVVYDFTTFNQELHSAWHGRWARLAAELAPGVPVHAKIMVHVALQSSLHGNWSVAPELFAEVSDLNGNDCAKWPRERGPWACDWLAENMAYDYQRSAADLPVFNSENHLIVDRDLRAVSPAFVRNVYWQGAVHGQAASTTWVWERTFDAASDLAGSIVHRPECAEAHAHVSLDLKRTAVELTALAAEPTQIAILWPQASAVWRGNQHWLDASRVYAAANFLGSPIGFVSERDCRVAAGGGSPRSLATARLLLLPATSHVTAETVAAIRRFAADGGTVVRFGDCLTHDETGRSRAVEPIGLGLSLPGDDDAIAATWRSLLPLAESAGLTPAVPLAVFGVEARSAKVGQRVVANLCNYLTAPVSTPLPPGGIDLLTGEPCGTELRLAPLEYRLIGWDE